MTNEEVKNITLESLRDWFKKEKWVRISSSGNIAGKCGTSKNKKNPDRCLPKAKAQSLTKGQRAATAAKKKKAGAKGKTVVKNTKKATVKEIGDLSQTPYKFTKLPSSKSSPYSYYEFITDNGTTYEVVFEREETDVATTYSTAFTAKGKEGDNFSSSALTGGNEPLKIMSTVVDITKKHLDKVDDADYLKFEPTKGKEGEKGRSNTRAKLYKLIIKKNFPNLEVIADDDTVLIDLDGYYDDEKLEYMKNTKKTTVKKEAYKPGSIAPKDLFYSDKHGKLVAMDDVDSKYHDRLELVYKKGDKIEDPMDEGLWANINAKKKAGKKPSHGNSNAHKSAEKAGKALGKEEYTGQHQGSNYKWPMSQATKDRKEADKKVTKEDIRNLVAGTIAEMQQNENLLQEDDRCTRLAKSKYDTWPSAYASGAVVRCRRGEIWKKK